jgi:hypothetical protein
MTILRVIMKFIFLKMVYFVSYLNQALGPFFYAIVGSG